MQAPGELPDDEMISQALTPPRERPCGAHRCMCSAEHYVPYIQQRIGALPYEVFTVLFFDAEQKLVDAVDMFRGTQSECVVHLGQIAREAYRRGASEVVVGHNHPLGDVTPSVKDIEVTRRLRIMMTIACVPLRDHVIVSEVDAHSMAGGAHWVAPLEEVAALLVPLTLAP